MGTREWFLKKLSQFVLKQYPFIIVISIFFTIASLVTTALFLKTKTGRIDLISSNNATCKQFLDFLNRFGSPDQLVILIEGGDAKEKATEALAAKLIQEKDFIADIFYRVPIEFFKDRGLYYADQKRLKEIQDSLNQFKRVLDEKGGRFNLSVLFKKMNQQLGKNFKKREKPSADEKENILFLSQLLDQIDLALREEKIDGEFSLTKEGMLSEEPLLQTRGFLTSRDQEIYFLFVKPTESKNDFKFIEVFLDRVKQRIDELKKEYPEINVALTGVPPIIYEEMTATTRDVTQASILSFIGIVLLFMFCFHAFRKPLIVGAVLLMGVSYTFCFATLAVGSLNMMSIVFVPMIMGLGIDFGIHILMRYREERLKKVSPNVAIETVIVHTGKGILTGAFSTAAVFYTLIFSDFKGFSEFGLIAGTGVLICCFSMLIVVPSFLILWEKSGRGTRFYESTRIQKKIQLKMPHVAKLLKYPRAILVISVFLTIYFLSQAKEVGFNGSLLDIQTKNPKSYLIEKKMQNSSSLSPRFAAVFAKNLEQVKNKTDQLKRLPAVGRVESVIDFLPETSTDKEKSLNEIKEIIEKLNSDLFTSSQVQIESFKKALSQIEKKILLLKKHAPEESQKELEWLLEFNEKIKQINLLLKELPLEKSQEWLQNFQNAFTLQLSNQLQQVRKMSQMDSVMPEDLPLEIRRRFMSRDGEFLLYVFPEKSIWSDAELYRFTEEVRYVDEQATGTPFLVREVTHLMQKGYKKAGWIALIAVIVLLLLDFRRLIPICLALLPLLVGVVWLLGLMGLLGINFNPANIIAIPLILGIAIDNGVHLVHRFFEKRAHRVDEVMKSTLKAVYLNSITTMVCFGALMLSSHRGIASLGLVLVLGLTTCLVTAITLLPALMILSKKYR